MGEAHLTGVRRGFQRDGAAYAKQRLPNPSKRHLGPLRRFLFSDRRGLVGVYRDNNWEIYAGALPWKSREIHAVNYLAIALMPPTKGRDITKIPIQLPDSIHRSQVWEILTGLSLAFAITHFSYQICIGTGKLIKTTVLPTYLCCQTWQLNSQCFSLWHHSQRLGCQRVNVRTTKDRATILQHSWYTSSYI